MLILRMRAIEIMLYQFRISKIFYPAASIAHTVNRFIMDDNKFSVFRKLHIQLDPVCAKLHRFLKIFILPVFPSARLFCFSLFSLS